MIDAAREFDARAEAMQEATGVLVDLVVAQIERLDALRIALASFIEQPAALVGEGASIAPDGEAAPARAVASSPDSPGSVRSEQRRRVPGDGHSPPPASGPVGTPTPASSETVACPECGQEVKRTGLGVHRRHRHGHTARPSVAERVAARDERRAAAPYAHTTDRRNIDEECPKGCGRRFRWEPTLLSHASKCDGKAES